MIPPAASHYSFRRYLVTIIVTLVACVILRVSHIGLIAFGPNSTLLDMFGFFPLLLCVLAWRRASTPNRTITAKIITIVVFSEYAMSSVVGLDRLLAAAYFARISLSENYAARCEPPNGSTSDGILFRACECHQWGQLNPLGILGQVVVVAKVSGDAGKLLRHEIKNGPKGTESICRLMPFGVSKYETTRIARDYYLIDFDLDMPPNPND
jgi:hypothetical protein